MPPAVISRNAFANVQRTYTSAETIGSLLECRSTRLPGYSADYFLIVGSAAPIAALKV